MTDEMIEVAKKAGVPLGVKFVAGDLVKCLTVESQRFYDLAKQKGAAEEREACAKLFDGAVWAYDYREIAAAIRARGEV